MVGSCGALDRIWDDRLKQRTLYHFKRSSSPFFGNYNYTNNAYAIGGYRLLHALNLRSALTSTVGAGPTNLENKLEDAGRFKDKNKIRLVDSLIKSIPPLPFHYPPVLEC